MSGSLRISRSLSFQGSLSLVCNLSFSCSKYNHSFSLSLSPKIDLSHTITCSFFLSPKTDLCTIITCSLCLSFLLSPKRERECQDSMNKNRWLVEDPKFLNLGFAQTVPHPKVPLQKLYNQISEWTLAQSCPSSLANTVDSTGHSSWCPSDVPERDWYIL